MLIEAIWDIHESDSLSKLWSEDLNQYLVGLLLKEAMVGANFKIWNNVIAQTKRIFEIKSTKQKREERENIS